MYKLSKDMSVVVYLVKTIILTAMLGQMVLTCDRLGKAPDVAVINCQNKTISAGEYFSECLNRCFEEEESCQAVLFPFQDLQSSTWCCLQASPEVLVANGNGYLVFDNKAVTMRRACVGNIHTPCAGSCPKCKMGYQEPTCCSCARGKKWAGDYPDEDDYEYEMTLNFDGPDCTRFSGDMHHPNQGVQYRDANVNDGVIKRDTTPPGVTFTTRYRSYAHDYPHTLSIEGAAGLRGTVVGDSGEDESFYADPDYNL